METYLKRKTNSQRLQSLTIRNEINRWEITINYRLNKIVDDHHDKVVAMSARRGFNILIPPRSDSNHESKECKMQRKIALDERTSKLLNSFIKKDKPGSRTHRLESRFMSPQNHIRSKIMSPGAMDHNTRTQYNQFGNGKISFKRFDPHSN